MEQITMFFRRNRNAVMCSDNTHGVTEIARFDTDVSDQTITSIAKKFIHDTYPNDEIIRWYRMPRVNEIICIHQKKNSKGGIVCFLKRLFRI